MAYAWRIRKKRAKKLLNEILDTGYFVDCSFHPMRLTEYGWGKWDHDVTGIALTNGGKGSCCLMNCVPEPITEKVALEMAEVWKSEGDKGLAVRYGGYSATDYDQFEKEWR